MSNSTLEKDVETVKKASSPNHLHSKTSGANHSIRSLAPLVRKYCACLATGSYKTEQKTPQKSSGVANKTATTNASSVNQTKRCSSKDLSTVSRKVNSAQVVQNDGRNESKATTSVSASSPPAVRQKGTITAKKQTEGEQNREQMSQQTTPIEMLLMSTKQTESKVAPPRKNLIKQFESASLAGSSKQSSKKIDSIPSSKSSKSCFKARPIVKEVPKEMAETKASKGKSKVPSDVHSVTTESDSSSDSDDDDLHLTWDGFEEDYTVGENCCLCQKDLSVRLLENNGHESEFSVLPIAAILPCGHVFHDDCLRILEGHYTNCPTSRCIFCESMSSWYSLD